jgi:NADPH-dependent 2,4-dienoyl-CoA reductase/sulfur reductase-like enzyme
VAVYLKEPFKEDTIRLPDYGNVANAQEVIVVGAGPAGLLLPCS